MDRVLRSDSFLQRAANQKLLVIGIAFIPRDCELGGGDSGSAHWFGMKFRESTRWMSSLLKGVENWITLHVLTGNHDRYVLLSDGSILLHQYVHAVPLEGPFHVSSGTRKMLLTNTGRSRSRVY